MANPNKTTETEQYILNRVKHTDIDALDVILYSLSTDGLTATPISVSAPLPTKVINSDGTDNSLSTGGQIGQKVQVVGDGDKYVRGVVAEGNSISQIQPILMGGDKSGNARNLKLDAQDAVKTGIYSAGWNYVDAQSTTTPLGISASWHGVDRFEPSATTPFTAMGTDTFVVISVASMTAGGADGVVSIDWDANGTTTALIGADYTETFQIGLNQPLQRTLFIPRRADYFRVRYTNGGVAQTEFFLNTCIAPIGSTGFVNVEGAVIVQGDGSGVSSSAPITVSGDDYSFGGIGGAPNIPKVDSSGTQYASITALTPGTTSTSLGKAEDAAHATGHVGVMTLAVRESDPVDLSAGATNGDYEPLEIDAKGRLWVNPTGRNTRSDVFTTTSNGTTVTVTDIPPKYFALQVVKSGAVTVWDVRLEGSIDGTNFSTILTHTNTTGDTVTIWGTTPFPCLYFRARCAGITGGTNVTAYILGTT